MAYMTVKEAGAKWKLKKRAVEEYCAGDKISGAIKKDNQWFIPEEAAKPDDRRWGKAPIQEEKEPAVSKDIYDLYKQNKHEGRWPFQSLYESKELFARIFKHFPYPLHICAPDGTILLANEAFLKFARISHPETLYKKHNILLNPCLERWGIKDFVLKAFRGETVHAYDVKVPHQEIIQRLGGEKAPPCGSLFQNMTAMPIRDDNNQLLFIVFIFFTSRHYQGREEIIKGIEYIEGHWEEEFDINKLAGIVHMSRSYYSRLFKRHTGVTPHKYYQNLKISKLKEKLCDEQLSISQVFAECGVDYDGNLVKVFKQKTGMSPSQYRASQK